MYMTTDVGKAAYLQLRGHQVAITVSDNGSWTFGFDPSARSDVIAYDQGAVVPAKIFAQGIRQLKAAAKKTASAKPQERGQDSHVKGHAASYSARQSRGT
jgi:hypothetical protein